MPRLFVAVWPPPAVVARLVALGREEQRGARWMPAENLHVTLRFLGEADVDDIAARLDRATMPAATAVLGPVVRRLGRNMIVVPAAGLDELAAVVGVATAGLSGRAGDERPFRGHVTIARVKHGSRSALLGAAVAAEFPVAEVTLVISELSHRGATYGVVRRWPTVV